MYHTSMWATLYLTLWVVSELECTYRSSKSKNGGAGIDHEKQSAGP